MKVGGKWMGEAGFPLGASSNLESEAIKVSDLC